eukprot:124478-Prymnesium_polylepis.1
MAPNRDPALRRWPRGTGRRPRRAPAVSMLDCPASRYTGTGRSGAPARAARAGASSRHQSSAAPAAGATHRSTARPAGRLHR